MTNTNDTGGPAYPVTDEFGIVIPGMTMLDYAAVEIAAQLAASLWPIDAKGHAIEDVVARSAYNVAAALVAEKRRREGGE